MSLTNTAIRNFKPGKRTVKLFDERGLYLEVSPAGGKWWRLKYRYESKEKRLSLGVLPDVTLKDARDRRDAARKLLASGIDPSENRKAQKVARADRAANSFEVVAREWLAKYSPNWALSHSDALFDSLNATSSHGSANGLSPISPRPTCSPQYAESKSGAHWTPRIERWVIAGRSSDMQGPPDAPDMIHPAIFAGRYPQQRVSTSRQRRTRAD